MDLNRDKNEIEVQDDDAIKRNQVLFHYMQRRFICLDGLYMDKKCLLIDAIKISIEEAECSGS